jgi:hypothetical protein
MEFKKVTEYCGVRYGGSEQSEIDRMMFQQLKFTF